MLANSILTWKVLSRERVADDDLQRAIQKGLFVESLSAKNGNSERGEIAGVGPTDQRKVRLPLRQGRVLSHGETAVSFVALPRNCSNERGGMDAGQSSDVFEQSLKET